MGKRLWSCRRSILLPVLVAGLLGISLGPAWAQQRNRLDAIRAQGGLQFSPPLR